jgi:DNA ligase-1
MIFTVMLAKDADLGKLRYPLLVSPKLDGIRAYVREGVVYSRKNKPIPNKHVQTLFKPYDYFDGELIVGDPTDPFVYRNTMSGVMSIEGEPDVKYFVFDHLLYLHEPFALRNGRSLRYNRKVTVALEQKLITTYDELLEHEAKVLELGYEGLILRDPNAPYKCGRSTVKEGGMLKLKRFSDAEFTVVGFEERLKNNNEATTDETGRTKRSSHKANKSGRGDLGALVLQHNRDTFTCGTGFTDAERADIWDNQDKYLGRLAKVKFFAIGAYDKPRHPVFLGWRDKRDV